MVIEKELLASSEDAFNYIILKINKVSVCDSDSYC